MKKRVRIYKPEKSKSTTSMKNFLNKAQYGAEQNTQIDQQALENYIAQKSIEYFEQFEDPQLTLNAIMGDLSKQINDPSILQLAHARANQYIKSYVEQKNQDTKLKMVSENPDSMTPEDEELYAKRAAEEEEIAQRRAQIENNNSYYQPVDYAEDAYDTVLDDDDSFSAFGGALPNKKQFVKNVFKLVKKANGGATEGKADPYDLPYNGRSDLNKGFISTVKTQAEDAALKAQIENMYDQQFGNLDQAQFGGIRPRQQRKMARQMASMMQPSMQGMDPGGIPNMFMGAGYIPSSVFEGVKMANIDAKLGMFGRLKSYSVNFDTVPNPSPELLQQAVEMQTKNEADNVKKDIQESSTTANPANQDALFTEDQIVVEGWGNGGGGGKKPPAPAPTPPVVPDTDDMSYDPKLLDSDPWRGLEPFWEATADAYKNKDLEYFAKKVKVNGKDVFKKWAFNPKTKKWYREGSKTPIKDQKAIKQLNTWLSSYNQNVKGNAEAASTWYPDQYLNIKNSFDAKLPSFSADLIEAPIQVVTGLDPSNTDDITAMAMTLMSGPRAIMPGGFKPMPKGYLPGQKALPNPQGGFSAPNAWGNTPKGLPWSGYNVRYTPPGGFQEGGITDYDSGLYRFIYGGNGPIMSTPGKITDDPYFRDGGLTTYQDKGEVKDLTTDELALAKQFNINDPNFSPDATRAKIKQMQREQWIDQQMQSGYRDPYSGWDGTGSMPFITASNAPQAWKDEYYRKTGDPRYNNPYIGNMYNPYAAMPYLNPMLGRRRPIVEYTGSWIQDLTPRVPASAFDGAKIKKITNKRGYLGNLIGPKSIWEFDGGYDYKLGDTPADGSDFSKSTQGRRGSSRSRGDEFRRRPIADLLLQSENERISNLGAKMYPWFDIEEDAPDYNQNVNFDNKGNIISAPPQPPNINYFDELNSLNLPEPVGENFNLAQLQSLGYNVTPEDFYNKRLANDAAQERQDFDIERMQRENRVNPYASNVNLNNEPVVQSNNQNPNIPVAQTNTSEPIENSMYSGAMGSTDEEYCLPGGVCFTMPDQLRADQRLFQDLPEVLGRYSDNTDKGWFTGDKKNQLDVSKLTRQDVLDALMAEKGSPNAPISDIESYPNLDNFIDDWLDYQSKNQQAYGNYDIANLSDDVFRKNIVETPPYERYSDWLTAMGRPSLEYPNDIFENQGVLGMPSVPITLPINQYPYENKRYGGLLKAQTGIITPTDDILPAPDYTDEELGLNEMVDVTPENIIRTKRGDFKKKFKQRNMFNIDFGRVADASITGKNMLAGFFQGLSDRDKFRDIYNEFSGDAGPTTNYRNMGIIDPQTGVEYPDKMGATKTWQGKHGGQKQGQVTYMSQKQIKDFLANGGQLEFI